MAMVGVNEFGFLVTRTSFNSGKMNIVAINYSFIDLKYMVYIFQYNSTNSKSNAYSRQKMVICLSMERLQGKEQDPIIFKWGELVCITL